MFFADNSIIKKRRLICVFNLHMWKDIILIHNFINPKVVMIVLKILLDNLEDGKVWYEFYQHAFVPLDLYLEMYLH